MSTTSKSPRKIALTALAVAKRSLPAYSHRFSPKTFTQPQLFACLVLKAFFKADYRGIGAILSDSSDLCGAIGLHRVPHFTTLQKASHRLLCAPRADRLITSVLRTAMGRRKRVEQSAMDSTGLEAHHVSHYFIKRRSQTSTQVQKTTYCRFPKLGILCDCRTHLILSAITVRGPCPDVHQFRKTLKGAIDKVCLQRLLADAGYDSEANHRYAREELGIRTIIPAGNGRPTDKLPSTKYRRLMRQRFNKKTYGQRWQVETVNSMIKRNFGSALSARHYWSQCREMMLRVLTHNIMIVLRTLKLFYRAGQAYFSLDIQQTSGGMWAMPRRLRIQPGGIVYHVHNRRAGRILLFETNDDYAAFERVLDEAQSRVPMRVLAS